MSNDDWRHEQPEGGAGSGGRASWQPGPADGSGSPDQMPTSNGSGYGRPIPPYASGPQDGPARWGQPAPSGQVPPHGQGPPYGPAAPYGQPPQLQVEHPKAQSLRTMGRVSIPLALFCNFFGLILAMVVLARVGGVTHAIEAGGLGGLAKVKQARTFAIIGLVVGVMGFFGGMAWRSLVWR